MSNTLDTAIDVEVPYCIDIIPPVPGWVNFLSGGTSGMVTRVVVHPADLVKTRMQLLTKKEAQTETTWSVAKGIVKRKGFIGLYAGLTAALFRNGTYTTAIFGIYSVMFENYKNTCGQPGYGTKLAIGLVAGGVGAIIGNPSEVILVRMQADEKLPVEKRRNYKHVFDAFYRIIKEEGVRTLYRGTVPTVTRGMLVNSAQLGTYSESKELMFPYLGDTVLLYFCSSVVAGLVSIFVSLPADIIKTRIQNDPVHHLGVYETFMQIIKHESPFALWHGFLPSVLKVIPQAILIFVFFEELIELYKKFGMEPPIRRCTRPPAVEKEEPDEELEEEWKSVLNV